MKRPGGRVRCGDEKSPPLLRTPPPPPRRPPPLPMSPPPPRLLDPKSRHRSESAVGPLTCEAAHCGQPDDHSRLLVVVAACRDADIVIDHLVDESVLVGNASRPVAVESVLERLGLSDAHVGLTGGPAATLLKVVAELHADGLLYTTYGLDADDTDSPLEVAVRAYVDAVRGGA